MLNALAFFFILKAPPIHLPLVKVLEAPQLTAEKFLGHATKIKKGLGYLFVVKGFDEFWLVGFDKDMDRMTCLFKDPCPRDKAFAALGLSSVHAQSRAISIGNAPIATRRNVCTLTGVTGLPLTKYSHKPWKVTFEEDGIINQARKDRVKAQIKASTGDARIALIRECYDWRPRISLAR
jgi:hypothetical protein